ncbi:MAG: O-antigen ligase family protein [Acidobacteriota bacterium]|nr:O-antigen ligase family protein [Acidobacteriota bacterium]
MLLAAILGFGILTLWVPARWALSAFQVALFALAAVRIAQRRSIGVHFAGLLLAAAAAWCALQMALGWSIDRVATLEATLNWIANLTAFALAADLYRNPQPRERFLRAALIFASVVAVVSIFTFLTSPAGKAFWIFETETGSRTLGPFIYHNQYAAFIEALLPLAIIGVIRDRRRWVLHALIVATLFGSVVIGGSRTGSILCLAEVLAVPLIAFWRGMIPGRVLARALVGSLAAVVVLTGVVGWERLWERLHEPNPYSLRQDLVLSSISMTRSRPLTGFGLGTWSEAYPGYARFDDGRFVNQAHNDWLQWASEGGLPFLALLLGIAAWSVKPALRSLWGVGILSVWLHALLDYPMQQRPALAAFFFALLGALASQTRFPFRERPGRVDDLPAHHG